MQAVEAVWDIIERHKNENDNQKKKLEENGNDGNNKAYKRVAEDDTQIGKVKKLKSDNTNKKIKEENNTCVDDKECLIEKFSYQQKILEIVQKKGTISLKKLEKKVINAYIRYMGEISDKEKLIKKFNKKIKKVPGIKIEDDNISLISF